MNFYCVLLVFSILQTGFGIKVPGNFKYCPTKDFCEMIKEIDVVEVFSSCTQNPFIKFFSKAANTVLRGFVDKTNELITKAQEIIPCDINQIRHDKFDGFNIIRESNRATVTLNDDSSEKKYNNSLQMNTPDKLFK